MKNKKKLLIIAKSTIFHTQTGGMETQLNNLIEGLKKNYKITVLTTQLDLYNKRFTEDTRSHKLLTEGVNYLFVKDTNNGSLDIFWWQTILYHVVNLIGLGGKIMKFYGLSNRKKNYHNFIQKYLTENKHDIDLIISQSTSIGVKDHFDIPLLTIIHGTIAGELKSRRNSLKNIKEHIRFFGYDLVHLNMIRYLFDKRIYNSSSHIIAVSNGLKKDFIKGYKHLEHKVSVIHNGVSKSDFADKKKYNKDLEIIYVGKIEIEKGLEVIKDVIQMIDFENYQIKFKIVGGGSYLEDFTESIRKMKKLENVSILGVKPQDEVYRYLHDSHIFLFPTLRIEGHPMTLIESMLAGTVAIVNPLGGIREVVTENESIIIEPNADKIVEKIYNLYEDRLKLKALSEASIDKGKDYTLEKMVAKYDKIIKKLIKKT